MYSFIQKFFLIHINSRDFIIYEKVSGFLYSTLNFSKYKFGLKFRNFKNFDKHKIIISHLITILLNS